MAAIISDVLGRPVRYQRIPAEAQGASMIERGMSEPIVQALLDMSAAKDNGLDNGVTRTAEFSTRRRSASGAPTS